MSALKFVDYESVELEAPFQLVTPVSHCSLNISAKKKKKKKEILVQRKIKFFPNHRYRNAVITIEGFRRTRIASGNYNLFFTGFRVAL